MAHPTAASLQTSNVWNQRCGNEVAGLVCPFSSSLHILTPGDLGELGAGKRVFLCGSKNCFKEMAICFFGTFFFGGWFMFRTENCQVLFFSNYPTMAEQ